MLRSPTFSRLVVFLVVFSLLFSAPAQVFAQDNTVFLPVVAGGNAPAAPRAVGDLLFRTRVTVATTVQWRDLTGLGVVILARGDDWALVLADDRHLEDLARWRYNPEGTSDLAGLAAANGLTDASLVDLLAQAQALEQTIAADAVSAAAVDAARSSLRAAIASLPAATQASLATAAAPDTDADGLTDTAEGWWCTDSAVADTDFDGTKDGDEVKALKEWVGNTNPNRLRAGPPVSGQPFSGWPPDNPGCLDNDRDSIPNLAELYDLGLNMAAESTDRDQFDDGQEVFGTTNCPGSGTGCGYGSLPPASNDPGVVLFPEMPGWVKAPGNHPLVAGLPVVEIDIVPSSLHVESVTTITTDKTISQGTEKSYNTAKTQGTSTGVANTVTWNDWEEVSESYEQKVSAATIADIAKTSGFNPGKFAGGALQVIGGVAVGAIPCAGGAFGTLMSAGLAGGVAAVACAGGLATGATLVGAGISDLGDAFPPDEVQANIQINEYHPVDVRLRNVVENQVDVTLNQSFDTSNIVAALEGNRLAYLQNGQVMNQRLYEIGQILGAPTYTEGSSKGHSWGGSQTTTTEKYEELTVTNGEAFSNAESWGTATAVDSAHAADFWFSYEIANRGDDFARKICDIAFNVYIGDDPAPAITYDLGPDLGGDGCLHNFKPAGTPVQRASRHIPISLNQIAAIDTGAPLRIVLFRYVLSTEDYYAEDAASRGLTFAMEDGTADGDELIDTYLIPTWGQETVLNVLARYFPHQTDANGMLTAIWTPEYRSDTPAWCQEPKRPIDQPTKALWCKHELSVADWWNVYTDGLGDGSEGFQDTPAAPGAVALFRFNQDTDHDGFSDRSEARLGTDPNDASSFPRPELLAGVHNIRTGNKVTSTLSLLNTGLYDAYGVEAVMVAPDDSVSIVNNTVGGSGRVRAQKQVIVGSRALLQSPLPAPWTQANHAVPAAGGYYTGSADRTYTFTVVCPAGGCSVGSGTWSVSWNDGKGAAGSLNFGAGYKSPTFLPVGAFGLTLALYTGSVQNGESFTVSALTPRDTFQYTINWEPHTEPLVIVSYNDPQGNHRFVLPAAAMNLTSPADNLQRFAGQMLHDVGVEIVTAQPFAPGSNTARLLVNNPSGATLVNAHLFLEFIDISGTVVSEVSSQVTLPPGPTYTPVTFSTGSFSPAYRAGEDYIVMAFLTDYQGNILDTAGRPLSSFQADPLPKLAVDDATLTWNFGTAVQGALLKRPLALANVGFGALYTYVQPGNGLSLDRAGRTVGGADLTDYGLTLRTAGLPVGAYDRTVTIFTSDSSRPSLNLRVLGTIAAPSGDTAGGAARPLDWPVTVQGPKSQGEWVEFTHTLGPEPQSLHPVKVYDSSYGTLLGAGRYATDLMPGMASGNILGTGEDGEKVVYTQEQFSSPRSALAADAAAGQTLVNLATAAGIGQGDEVLILQLQGANAGVYEFQRVASLSGNQLTLSRSLAHPYSQGGANRAQVVRVPNYTNVTVTTGNAWHAPSWDGSTGGVLVFRANGTVTVQSGAQIDATGKGYRGGNPSCFGSACMSGFAGESNLGVGAMTTARNGNGGGGGMGDPTVVGGGDGSASGGGGGGHAADGANGQNGGGSTVAGVGGLAVGDPSLSYLFFGGGGGAGGCGDNAGYAGQPGTSGGGVILLSGRTLNIQGTIHTNGPNAVNPTKDGAGGGGSGGTIRVQGFSVDLGTNLVSAIGGLGGITENDGDGGNGSVGRIQVEYCESISGTTNPQASVNKLTCFMTEQIESAPFSYGRLNLPENVTGSKTYQVQYARKLNFNGAGSQTTTLRVPAGMLTTATLDALISQLPADASFALDIGADGVNDWTATVANNSTTASPNLAAAFDAWWASHGAPTTGNLDVPVRVTLGQAGQVLLTNLQVTTAGSKQRAVRLPAQSYSTFNLDFTVGGSGGPLTVALDVGANGSVDWNGSAASLPFAFKTGNLAAAINAYLAGKSGAVDVPLRFFVAPDAPVTLTDYQVSAPPAVDLAAASLSLGAAVGAASTAAYKEGDKIALQAVLNNPSGKDSGPLTAAFFATAAGWGDWYIGSAFLPTIPAGGSAQASILWDTTGFGSAAPVPVKVVVNPYGRTPETSWLNNSKSMSVAVTPIQANQTITFGALADRLLGTPPFALSATASSGLPVSFATLTPAICTVSGGTVTLVATGVCTIRATQPGNAFFYAAPPKTQSFAVRSATKTNQAITFAAPPERTLGDPAFALNATASSGLTVSYATQTPNVCTVAGNLVTLAAAGGCSIQALQNGNATYNPATPVTRSFTVRPARASQTITFAQPVDKTLGAAPFALSATALSGLAVSFASLTQGVCTVSGATVTLVAVGACTIRATQAGNAGFDAAPAVERSFAVVAPPVVKQDQTISFAAPADRTLGDAPFTLAATASSGLPVSFASLTAGVCTVSGNTVTLVAAGTCTITSTQGGNHAYRPALAVTRSFVVRPRDGTPEDRVYLPVIVR